MWDALTGIFEDLDRQGGGAEAEELEDTLDELRGLLEMHTQLRGKAVELEAMRLEVTRERDAALSMLYELEEETSPSGQPLRMRTLSTRPRRPSGRRTSPRRTMWARMEGSRTTTCITARAARRSPPSDSVHEQGDVTTA